MTLQEAQALHRDHPDEFNAATAKMMGWTRYEAFWHTPGNLGCTRTEPPDYAHDATSDYTVLDAKRDDDKFRAALWSLIMKHYGSSIRNVSCYRVGDYSIAALAAESEKAI